MKAPAGRHPCGALATVIIVFYAVIAPFYRRNQFHDRDFVGATFGRLLVKYFVCATVGRLLV